MTFMCTYIEKYLFQITCIKITLQLRHKKK